MEKDTQTIFKWENPDPVGGLTTKGQEAPKMNPKLSVRGNR